VSVVFICQNREHDRFILAFWVDAIGAGQIDDLCYAAIGQSGITYLFINGNAGKISYFLVKTG